MNYQSNPYAPSPPTTSHHYEKSSYDDEYTPHYNHEDEDHEHVTYKQRPKLTYATSHSYHDEDEDEHSDYGDDHIGAIPSGAYHDQVHEFDTCEEIWDQEDYEQRLETEAELMIALEAIREALV